MANTRVEQPLVVIVGPTASGKTGLALDLAEKYNGEIIAADSRTIYRGLDIGTAKPTALEQDRVRHFGLDLVDVDDTYSAAQFQQYVKKAITDIRTRGKVPVLVGGTGLYVNAVIYDYAFAESNVDLREKLEQMDIKQLQNYCSDNNIPVPEKGTSKRHAINHIVRNGRPIQREYQLNDNIYVVGITTDKLVLRERIHTRAADMFDSSIAEETQKMAQAYGWDTPGLSGNIYQIVRLLLSGAVTREEAIQLVETRDWQLAKRQLTWFRRDPNIQWLQIDEAEHYIDQILASEH